MDNKVKFDEKTKEAFKNKAFVQKLLTLETGEEVRAALKEKGVILSVKELDKFAEILVVALEKGNAVTQSDLELVIGGTSGDSWMNRLVSSMISVANRDPTMSETPYMNTAVLLEKSYFGKIQREVRIENKLD